MLSTSLDTLVILFHAFQPYLEGVVGFLALCQMRWLVVSPLNSSTRSC